MKGVLAIVFFLSLSPEVWSSSTCDDSDISSIPGFEDFNQCVEDVRSGSPQKTADNRQRTAAKKCQEQNGKLFINGVEVTGTPPAADLNSELQCQCPGSEEKRDLMAKNFSCSSSSKDEDSDDEEENPFECAEGGGGAAAQGAQQAKQQRAQLENQCNQSFEQARVACDTDSVVGVDGLVDEAEAKAEAAKAAGEKGLKQACEEYRQAFERASSELRSFRGSCASAKASCITSCKQAMVANSELAPAMALVASCLGPLGAIASAMMQSNASIEQVQIKDCTGFETILKEADNKVKELTESMREADKCQGELQESCKANPRASHCRQLNAADALDSSQMQEVGADLTSPNTSLGGGGGLGSGANIAPVKLEKGSVNTIQGGGASANLGGGGGGGSGGPTGASGGGGGYYSDYDELYERMKGDQFNRAKRGGAMAGTGYKPRSRANFKRNGSQKRRSASKSFDLKKYLPGGSHDPNRFRDGITPASGPSIFEKVSNRYKVHKMRLMP